MSFTAGRACRWQLISATVTFDVLAMPYRYGQVWSGHQDQDIWIGDRGEGSALPVMAGRVPATHPRSAGAPRTWYTRRCVGGRDTPGHDGESHHGQGHHGEGHRGEGHRGGGHRGEGHRSEGHHGEGHRGEGHRSEGHHGESHGGEGRDGESEFGSGPGRRGG